MSAMIGFLLILGIVAFLYYHGRASADGQESASMTGTGFVIVLGAVAIFGGLLLSRNVPPGEDGWGVLLATVMLFTAGAILMAVGLLVWVVGSAVRGLMAAGGAEPVDTTDPAGPTCPWCRQAVPAGQRPCSYNSDAALRQLAPTIADQTCRRVLTERGLLQASAS